MFLNKLKKILFIPILIIFNCFVEEEPDLANLSNFFNIIKRIFSSLNSEKLLRRIKIRTRTSRCQRCTKLAADINNEVIFMKKTPAEAAKKFITKANEILAKNKK